jgi:hypothetical protein
VQEIISSLFSNSLLGLFACDAAPLRTALQGLDRSLAARSLPRAFMNE